MRRLQICVLVFVVLAALTWFFAPRAPTTIPRGKGLVLKREWLVNHDPRLTPVEHQRPPDQTFLTYPEWFLVFGPAEQADFFQGHTATKFPFMSHVRQIWESYRVVYSQIRGNYPFNTGYHVMIGVIATSSTAEFGIKAAYETLIGRLTDTPDGASLTAEDRFNAAFTRDYVKFIETSPWYEFDFQTQLGKLWRENPLFGSNLVRKWERRYILTTELVVKSIYGWLIQLGTRTAYDRPKLVTAVVVDHVPDQLEKQLPEAKMLTNLPDGSTLLTLPRYAPFSSNACVLATGGTKFREIAGNNSAILISVLAPTKWDNRATEFQTIFTQPIPTRPGLKRVALATPVEQLSQTLTLLLDAKLTIEHIYDF